MKKLVSMFLVTMMVCTFTTFALEEGTETEGSESKVYNMESVFVKELLQEGAESKSVTGQEVYYMKDSTGSKYDQPNSGSTTTANSWIYYKVDIDRYLNIDEAKIDLNLRYNSSGTLILYPLDKETWQKAVEIAAYGEYGTIENDLFQNPYSPERADKLDSLNFSYTNQYDTYAFNGESTAVVVEDSEQGTRTGATTGGNLLEYVQQDAEDGTVYFAVCFKANKDGGQKVSLSNFANANRPSMTINGLLQPTRKNTYDMESVYVKELLQEGAESKSVTGQEVYYMSDSTGSKYDRLNSGSTTTANSWIYYKVSANNYLSVANVSLSITMRYYKTGTVILYPLDKETWQKAAEIAAYGEYGTIENDLFQNPYSEERADKLDSLNFSYTNQYDTYAFNGESTTVSVEDSKKGTTTGATTGGNLLKYVQQDAEDGVIYFAACFKARDDGDNTVGLQNFVSESRPTITIDGVLAPTNDLSKSRLCIEQATEGTVFSVEPSATFGTANMIVAAYNNQDVLVGVITSRLDAEKSDTYQMPVDFKGNSEIAILKGFLWRDDFITPWVPFISVPTANE